MSLKFTLLVCAMGVLIAFRDVPRLLREKNTKELLVYLFMLGLGTWLSILGINLEQISSPLEAIVFIFNPVKQMIQHIFS